VRVDDQARKSVVFVGARDGDRFTPLGTGFLASVRYQTVPLIPLIFVVTADHVVAQIASARRKHLATKLAGPRVDDQLEFC
jgi:hypothetical protein